MTRLATVASLKRGAMIVYYDSRVVLTLKFVYYDSRIVICNSKMFDKIYHKALRFFEETHDAEVVSSLNSFNVHCLFSQ